MTILCSCRNIKKGYLHQATFYTADIFKDMLVNSEGKEKLQGFFHTSSQMGLEKVQQWHGDRLDRLSGGEKTKLALTAIWAEKPAFIILDEPTNHLDLHAREKLEETLENYGGTVLLVSHDRYMMEKLCDKLLVFENNGIERLEYRLKTYLEDKEKRSKGMISHNTQAKEEEKLIIENRITYVLGELGKYDPKDPEYARLDLEFKDLIEKKKSL